MQSYNGSGTIIASPTFGWISGVNWAGPGGTAGCIRHNVASATGSWFGWSPAFTLTSGKEYYVVFGARLSAYTASYNQRVQVRVGTNNTSLLGATIVMGSISLPAAAGTTYQEYTSPLYTAPSTGTFYFAVGNFFTTAANAFYLDGIRIYEKYVAPALPDPDPACYRSVSSGQWKNPATWEYRVNCTGSWVPSTQFPSFNSLGTEILAGHTVTLDTIVTCPSITVAAGATLAIATGGSLTVGDAAGTDLIVNGTLQNNGGLISNLAGATTQINNIYNHNRDGGALPTATWGASSFCNIIGMTANAPTNFAQSFANIIWNSPSQTGNPNLTGSNNPINVSGVFEYRSAGTLDLSNINRVWTGDLYVGGVVALMRLSASGTSSLTVNNLTINDQYISNARLLFNNSSSSSSISSSLFVNGNVLINPTANVLSIGMNTFATPALPIAVLDVKGDFIHNNGIITAAAASGPNLVQSVIRFTGSGEKKYIRTAPDGSYSNINWSIFSPAVVDFENYYLDNVGNFTLTGGAGMKIGSQAGISTTGSTGTIRNTVGTRSFNGGGSITYYNAYGAGVQNTGNGLPASLANLTINNSNGVTLDVASVSVDGILALENGVLNAGATNTVTTTATGSVVRTNGWVAGNLRKHIPAGNPVVTFEVGRITAYRPTTLSFAGVSIPGSYRVRVEPGQHPDLTSGCFTFDSYVNQYWRVTNEGVSPANYGASFTYAAADYVGSVAAANLRVGRFNGTWNYPTIVGTPTNTIIYTSGNSGDGDFAVAMSALEICYNGIDDDCDGLIDEDCIIPLNDGPLNATLIAVTGNSFPNCGVLTGNLQGATDSPQSPESNGPDVWYRFVAQSTAVSITMNGSSQNNIILLYNNSLVSMPDGVENVQGVGGAETLNYDGLIPGQQYYLSIGATAAPAGQFQLCLRHLAASFCADGSGVYQLCSNLKAQFTGATTYTYHFTPTGITPGVPTSVSINSGQLPLSNIVAALRYGGTYNVRIDGTFSALTFANNLPDAPITVPGIQTCDITIAPHAEMFTREIQVCPATLLRGSILQGKPFICSATSFTVEFTRVTNCTGATEIAPPFTVNTPGASSNLNLSFVSPQPLIPGAWYKVRWRPNFSYGFGDFGSFGVIRIGGSAMEEEVTTLPQLYKTAEYAVGDGLHAAIYPNPGKGELLNINATGIASEQLQVRIMDSMGKLVFYKVYNTESNFNTILNFNNPLTSGLYLIEFTSGDETITKKLMIEK